MSFREWLSGYFRLNTSSPDSEDEYVTMNGTHAVVLVLVVTAEVAVVVMAAEDVVIVVVVVVVVVDGHSCCYRHSYRSYVVWFIVTSE